MLITSILDMWSRLCGRMILHQNVKSSTNGAWRLKYLLGATVLSVGWGEYTAVSLPFFFFFLESFLVGLEA